MQIWHIKYNIYLGKRWHINVNMHSVLFVCIFYKSILHKPTHEHFNSSLFCFHMNEWWMNKWCIYIALYCVLLYTQSTLQSCGGVSPQPPPVCSIHWMIDDTLWWYASYAFMHKLQPSNFKVNISPDKRYNSAWIIRLLSWLSAKCTVNDVLIAARATETTTSRCVSHISSLSTLFQNIHIPH